MGRMVLKLPQPTSSKSNFPLFSSSALEISSLEGGRRSAICEHSRRMEALGRSCPGDIREALAALGLEPSSSSTARQEALFYCHPRTVSAPHQPAI